MFYLPQLPQLQGFEWVCRNQVGFGKIGYRAGDTKTNRQCSWLKTDRGAKTAPETPCWQRLRSLAVAAAAVVVEQVTAPTVYVSCPGCEIPGRSGLPSTAPTTPRP